MGCPSWAKDCRPLRPASGSILGASSTPVIWGLTPNRARKPVQTQGLARVVTGTVTPLAGEGGALEALGGAGSASPGISRTRISRGAALPAWGAGICTVASSRLSRLRGRCVASRCADDDVRRLKLRRGSAASGARPIALDDGLRRRQATRVAEGEASLQRSLPPPGLVATLPGRNSGRGLYGCGELTRENVGLDPRREGGLRGAFWHCERCSTRAASSPPTARRRSSRPLSRRQSRTQTSSLLERVPKLHRTQM
jgi:hypothetical protein